MAKPKTPTKRKVRSRKKKKAPHEVDVDATSTVKESLRAGGGGGVMQSLRNGFKRAAGAEDGAEESKPSTVSNIIWTVLLLAALGFLLYRWYG